MRANCVGVHGPHEDQATPGAAGLVAETIRYLSYAAALGGFTNPATVYVVAGDLSAAAGRLPQIAGSIAAEAAGLAVVLAEARNLIAIVRAAEATAAPQPPVAGQQRSLAHMQGPELRSGPESTSLW